VNPLSKTDKLLVAAAALASDGNSEFTAEDLIVRAHTLFPGDFSLKGYREYPNSNAVLTQVMGIKAPLIVRGWVEKTGTKRYRITPKGLHDLSDRTGDQANSTTATEAFVSIERKQDESIGRLLTSTAFELFKKGRADEITFHHFCRFVGLSARDKWQRIAGRLKEVEHLIDEARQIGEGGQGLRVFLERLYNFEADDLRLLPALYAELTDRFRKEMDQWRRHAT
jgi:hypothetical protein